MDELLKRLNSRKKAEREAAQREVQALPEEQFVQLLILEAERYPALPSRLFRLLYNGVTHLPWIILWVMIVQSRHIDLPLYVALITFTLFRPFVCDFIPRPRVMQTRLFLAKTLESCNDPRIVPVLLTMLHNHLDRHRERKLRSRTSKTLIRLGPQVRADHALLFTETHHKIIHALLTPSEAYSECERTVALLKALEQVGNPSDLLAVQKLTEANAWAKVFSKYGNTVRQAAQECLPYLTQRAEEARNANTLLRASAANTTSPDLLLRAAAATNNSTPAQELLRAETRNVI